MEKSGLKLALNFWILLLRINAGYLNALSIMTFGTMTSGHTGNITKAFISLADGKFNLFYGPILLLLCFFLGSLTSGYFFPYENFKLYRSYGKLFFLFAVIYFGLSIIDLPPALIVGSLTFILGVQNGLFVFYRGVIVRTTNLTGTITDIGIALGKHLRSKQVKVAWKLKFFTLNLVAFGFGAAICSLFFYHTDWNIILIASFFNLLICFYSVAIRRKFKDVFSEGNVPFLQIEN